MQVVRLLYNVLTDTKYRWLVVAAVVFGDAILTALIIHFVPYTEIDWETYMFHIDLYKSGERNYTAISGPTGPLVYPAGHVYVHDALHDITAAGLNIPKAQRIYGVLYVVSLALTCLIYGLAGSVPNYVFLLLPLSKRLHSIYVLRLFNDCWLVPLMQLAVIAYGCGWDFAGTALFSMAMSVKMSALLYFPAILLLLWKRSGPFLTAYHTTILLIIQALIGAPFLGPYPHEYITGAFDLSRTFLYKWTVNWRFLDETVFLSSTWARGLLMGHLVTLSAFAICKWCMAEGGIAKVVWRGLTQPFKATACQPLSFDHVVTILATANLIGILFARSLHYQFYAWYAYQIPFLVWRTRYHLSLKLLIILMIEYSWNVFPSTTLSSTLLLFSHCTLLIGIWLGYPVGRSTRYSEKKLQ